MTASIASAGVTGSRIAITGGLGFIGATLARRLIEQHNDVLIIDNHLTGSGANMFNLDGIAHRVTIERCDVRDSDSLRPLLADCKYLFNLAAQTSHRGSMADPMLDLDINSRAQLGLLEVCRAIAPEITIVFASTRQIYGIPEHLPVDENHPIRPVDVNGIDKAAGEAFHLLYNRVYGLRCCSLRLTNTYGPRMRIADDRQNFVGIWLRAVIEGSPIALWGGDQVRDFVYVDDAVEAFITAAATPAVHGKALNIAGDPPVTLRRLAEILVAANGGGRFEVSAFPEERKKIDIGSYYGDDRLFRRLSGWSPRVGLEEGLKRSLAFFRPNLNHYLFEH